MSYDVRRVGICLGRGCRDVLRALDGDPMTDLATVRVEMMSPRLSDPRDYCTSYAVGTDGCTRISAEGSVVTIHDARGPRVVCSGQWSGTLPVPPAKAKR